MLVLTAWLGSGPWHPPAICASCERAPAACREQPLSREPCQLPVSVGHNKDGVSGRQPGLGSCVRNKGAFVAGTASSGRFVGSGAAVLMQGSAPSFPRLGANQQPGGTAPRSSFALGGLSSRSRGALPAGLRSCRRQDCWPLSSWCSAAGLPRATRGALQAVAHGPEAFPWGRLPWLPSHCCMQLRCHAGAELGMAVATGGTQQGVERELHSVVSGWYTKPPQVG